jgi:hypothetical protein
MSGGFVAKKMSAGARKKSYRLIATAAAMAFAGAVALVPSYEAGK